MKKTLKPCCEEGCTRLTTGTRCQPHAAQHTAKIRKAPQPRAPRTEPSWPRNRAWAERMRQIYGN